LRGGNENQKRGVQKKSKDLESLPITNSLPREGVLVFISHQKGEKWDKNRMRRRLKNPARKTGRKGPGRKKAIGKDLYPLWHQKRK